MALAALLGIACAMLVACGSGASEEESAAPDVNGGDVAAQSTSLGGSGGASMGSHRRKPGPGRCRSTRCR